MAPWAYGQTVGPSSAASEDALVQEAASAYCTSKHGVDVAEAQRRLLIQDRSAGIQERTARR